VHAPSCVLVFGERSLNLAGEVVGLAVGCGIEGCVVRVCLVMVGGAVGVRCGGGGLLSWGTMAAARAFI
jgi:hypothetical protein